MALYLGLDVGTQGVKAVVYSADSRKIVARGAHPLSLLPTDVPGRAEQRPADWIDGVRAAARQALAGVADASQVKAIGVSGQQHGLVALGEGGCVLRPSKLWCDTESAPEAEELSRKLGTTLVASFTATKVLWLARHEPEVYASARHVLLPGSYVNYWLTGRMAMEAGDASGTGVFDTAARRWDFEAADAVDPRLRGMLPPLLGPEEAIGTLRPEVAAELGLPEGVVVAPGSGDNAMSALGSGATADGQLVVSLGTSGTLFGVSASPIIDKSGTIAPFCDATGAWLPLVCTLNCTRVPEEAREAFGLSQDDATALAGAEAPGCHGVNYLPYLAGARTPNWPHASGAVLGLRPGLLRPGLLYRAAMEGATFSLRAGLARMQDLGMTARELFLVGGGSKNALWQQIVADAFQMPVRLPLEPESAALGAALQAGAVHSGGRVAEFVAAHHPPVSEQVIQPNAAHKAAYDEAYARHCQLGAQLFAGGSGGGGVQA
ncbi:MAG: Xylulokinase [Monoraphidium minutum]|nr:MAG: Xylulokinase [Monoraphidium minutum]